MWSDLYMQAQRLINASAYARIDKSNFNFEFCNSRNLAIIMRL